MNGFFQSCDCDCTSMEVFCSFFVRDVGSVVIEYWKGAYDIYLFQFEFILFIWWFINSLSCLLAIHKLIYFVIFHFLSVFSHKLISIYLIFHFADAFLFLPQRVNGLLSISWAANGPTNFLIGFGFSDILAFLENFRDEGATNYILAEKCFNNPFPVF
jgi:hypothetical protein